MKKTKNYFFNNKLIIKLWEQIHHIGKKNI